MVPRFRSNKQKTKIAMPALVWFLWLDDLPNATYFIEYTGFDCATKFGKLS